MKLLVITNLFPTSLDPGRATFNYQQFRELSKYHDIEVLVPVSWIDYVHSKRDKKFDPGMKYKIIPFFNIPGFARILNPFFIFISLILFLFPYSSVFKANAFILSWAYPDAVAGSMLAMVFNKKTICKVHGNDINVFATHVSKKPLIKWALNRSSAVVAVSNDLAKKVKALGINKPHISTIYNGVNHAVFNVPEEKHTDHSTKTILYVGNLKVKKGCLDLFEAVNEIDSRDSDSYELVYIGDGPCGVIIKEKSRVLDDNKKVILLGRLPHNEIVDWYKKADLLCLPSYNEGVPNVVLEAMACGLPVIATNVGGIPEVLPESCGQLVDAGDISALSKALKEFDGGKYQAQALLNESAKFDWNKNADSFNKLLFEVV